MRGQRLSCVAAKEGNDESMKDMKTTAAQIQYSCRSHAGRKSRQKPGMALEGSEMGSQPLYMCAAFRVGIRIREARGGSFS